MDAIWGNLSKQGAKNRFWLAAVTQDPSSLFSPLVSVNMQDNRNHFFLFLNPGCQLWSLRQQGAQRQQRGPNQTQLPDWLDTQPRGGTERKGLLTLVWAAASFDFILF